MQVSIEVIKGDITQLEVDAIVNAANFSLRPGGGVCGAIHQAAGPELAAECNEISFCEPGQAVLTRGYELPAKFVIHTVGPVWRGNLEAAREVLKSCYKESMILASQKRFKSIAFPCISTGIYRFPPELATHIAVATVWNIAVEYNSIERVIFCCYDDVNYESYCKSPLGNQPKLFTKLTKEKMWE